MNGYVELNFIRGSVLESYLNATSFIFEATFDIVAETDLSFVSEDEMIYLPLQIKEAKATVSFWQEEVDINEKEFLEPHARLIFSKPMNWPDLMRSISGNTPLSMAGRFNHRGEVKTFSCQLRLKESAASAKRVGG